MSEAKTEALERIIGMGEYASEMQTLGNDILYFACENHPITFSENEAPEDLKRQKGELSSFMWLIGRSYAASPERYSYSIIDSKQRFKPKDYDSGYETFFQEVSEYLFSGDTAKESSYQEFKSLREHICHSLNQKLTFEDEEKDAVFLYESAKAVVEFAGILRKARLERDRRILPGAIEVLEGNAKKEKELNLLKVAKSKWDQSATTNDIAQSWPISFSSKLLHFYKPEAIFIVDSIASNNLRGLKSGKSLNLALDKLSIKLSSDAFKEFDEQLPRKEEFKNDAKAQEVFDEYLNHCVKEYLITKELLKDLGEDKRNLFGKNDSNPIPHYTYKTRMVDAFVSNAKKTLCKE